MPPKAYVILNPVAGQSDPGRVKEYLEAARSDGRMSYDLYETTGEEDLKKVVKKALEGDYDLVIACGGDGTVSGTADGLAETGVPLGILPLGTTNAFATELGIPDDPKDALELLLEGARVEPVDAIQWEERHFILEASLGAFSASFEDVAREKKDRLGWLAFVDTVIRNWIGLDPLRVSVNVDGKGFSFRASEIALFNTS